MGSQIELPDGTSAWRASPAAASPGVLVLHPWWGLNGTVRATCDRLATDGFVAVAPDLFGDGRVARTVEDAQAQADGADDRAVRARASAGLAALLADPVRSGSTVAALGFSFGAAWGLALAEEHPEIAGAIVYYGTGGGDPSASRAAVLGHLVPGDPWEPDEYVAPFEAALRAAGRDVELHRYPGTHHWFAEPDRPEHDPASAGLAWERTLAFLRARLAG
jgi:carboxymethylenebutenolidase